MMNAALRDTGKSPVQPASGSPGMAFKEQQLKQLRAQCIVLVALRNGLLPKKLHLDIALGNSFPKEGGNMEGTHKEFIDHKGKTQFSNEPNSISDATTPYGRLNNETDTDRMLSGGNLPETDSLSKKRDNLNMEEKNGPTPYHSVLTEERRHHIVARKPESETQRPKKHHSSLIPSGGRSGATVSNPVDNVKNGHFQGGRPNQSSSLMGTNQQDSDIHSWSGVGGQSEVSRGLLSASTAQPELVSERYTPAQFPNLDSNST